jgi:hypothetical protein
LWVIDTVVDNLSRLIVQKKEATDFKEKGQSSTRGSKKVDWNHEEE